MKKYRCECSVDKCEFKSEKNFFPIFCPNFSSSMGEWTKVEEEIKEEEKAEELPSWCKVGKVVYHKESNKFFKIATFNEEAKLIELKDNGWFYLDELAEARLRPFNESEMRALVGKTIANKITETSYLIVTSNPYCVSAAGDMYCSEKLFDLFTFTDGTPCGVYEHKENGEWVE